MSNDLVNQESKCVPVNIGSFVLYASLMCGHLGFVSTRCLLLPQVVFISGTHCLPGLNLPHNCGIGTTPCDRLTNLFCV